MIRLDQPEPIHTPGGGTDQDPLSEYRLSRPPAVRSDKASPAERAVDNNVKELKGEATFPGETRTDTVSLNGEDRKFAIHLPANYNPKSHHL